jgi:single-stranded DNA-specific DHH superfamily exonuclease
MHHVSDNFFTEFGGHHASGGFAFEKDKRDVFEEEMKKAYAKYVAAKNNSGIVEEKAEEEEVYHITHDAVDNYLLKHLSQMKPFGMKNPNPLFCIKHVVFREVKYFGKQKEHAEFMVGNFINDKGQVLSETPELFQETYKYSAKNTRRDVVKYISFFADPDLREIQKDIPYDIYGRVEESNFLGKKEIRVKVEYINVSDK